jgi:hypothetical protein
MGLPRRNSDQVRGEGSAHRLLGSLFRLTQVAHHKPVAVQALLWIKTQTTKTRDDYLGKNQLPASLRNPDGFAKSLIMACRPLLGAAACAIISIEVRHYRL